MLANAHPPKDHACLGPGKIAGDGAQRLGGNAADCCHFLGRELGKMFLFGLPVLSEGSDILLVVKPFLNDHMADRVQHCHIRTRAELQHMGGKALHALAARVHDDELATALGELLEIGRGDRVVLKRICPDDDRYIGIFDLVERRRHGTRPDILDQRRH